MVVVVGGGVVAVFAVVLILLQHDKGQDVHFCRLVRPARQRSFQAKLFSHRVESSLRGCPRGALMSLAAGPPSRSRIVLSLRSPTPQTSETPNPGTESPDHAPRKL